MRGASGDLSSFVSLATLDKLLIAARIATRTTIRDLSERIGVDESQISRYEWDGYRGIGLDRAQRILAELGVEVRLQARPLEPAATSRSDPSAHAWAEAAEQSTAMDALFQSKECSTGKPLPPMKKGSVPERTVSSPQPNAAEPTKPERLAA